MPTDKQTLPEFAAAHQTREFAEARADDAALFRLLLAFYGGNPGKQPPRLLAFLREHGVISTAIDYLAGYNLNRASGVNCIALYSATGVIQANRELAKIALRNGLLVVGHCPNGDQVAVDVRVQLGAVGYIECGAMWHRPSIREVFAVIAPDLGRLARRLHDEGDVPLDYYDARRSLQS